MVNVLTTETVTSFSELLSKIEEFQGDTDVSWYRGCRSESFKLVPTLFRHGGKKVIESLLDLEGTITTRFVQRSIPYISRALVDDWDKMFFMQHYGVPTRLLDWTENPLVAAYFALEENEKYKNKNAAIWLCDPIKWNRSALAHISYTGGVLDQTSTIVANHRPGTAVGDMPSIPIMMFGSYNSSRIVAQRGVFSLFGKSIDPIEDMYIAGNYEPGCVKKIVVPAAKVDEIRNSLFRKGITESVVFPELDGLAKEIKKTYGY